MTISDERQALRAEIRAAHEAAKDLRATIREARNLINGEISTQIDTAVRRELGRLGDSAERAMTNHARQIGEAFDRMVTRMLGSSFNTELVRNNQQAHEFRDALGVVVPSREEQRINGNRRPSPRR